MKNTRDPYIDNIRFILVTLVVLGHLMSPFKGDSDIVYLMNNFLSSFRMPALILLTGFFTKKFHEKGYIEKITIRVFIPFLIFQLLYNLDHWQSINWLMPSFGLWFLLSLYWWNLLLFIFTKLNRPIITSLIIGIGIGVVEGAGHEFSLSRTLVFFPFFLLGHYLDKSAFESFKAPKAKMWSLLSAITSLIILSVIPLDVSRDYLLGRSSFDTMGIGVLNGVSLRIAFYFVMLLGILFLFPWIPKKSTSFTLSGRRTAFIYILHLPIIGFLKSIGWSDGLSLWKMIILLPLSYGIARLLSQKNVVSLTKYLVVGEIVNSLRLVSKKGINTILHLIENMNLGKQLKSKKKSF